MLHIFMLVILLMSDMLMLDFMLLNMLNIMKMNVVDIYSITSAGNVPGKSIRYQTQPRLNPRL